MIYIRDNGGEYDCHSIAFIEVPDEVDAQHRDVIKRALAARDVSYNKPFLIGVVQCVEWRDPAPVPAREFLKDLLFYGLDVDEEELAQTGQRDIEAAMAVLP